ncbi:MAG: chromosome segregation protein SMC [Actinomycetaceae bacterium]|nr:chromosome segregation protein SMC [Actinomycetaceae bacterium]
MHLKTLTIRGFKSFAGATTIRLEPGITCVVGPNGSGKSNVVDALAWVMGEQGARALRGGNMADVIFAGTSSRPALGRAQVDLTIDNSDGALPIDYSEVTISRTLFRGGGSEYSINGTPARLLDIQELLSDTGMGRQMHVIVGQGQLDTILHATPEERRAFIEEAAGVLKHRRRKERALKKLGDMDANLVRVLDLTNEIHRQLGPLARQAKVARRAHLVQGALRDAKARLLADDLVQARERLNAQGSDTQAMRQRQEDTENAIAQVRRDLAALEEGDHEAAARFTAAVALWQQATTIHERLGGTLMVARERLAVQSRPIPPPSSGDPDELDQRAEQAGVEDGELLAEVERQEVALGAILARCEESEKADTAAARELARVNRAVSDHREKVARLTGDVSSAVSRHEAAQAECERAKTAFEEARGRAEVAQKEAADLPEDAGGEESQASAAHAAAVTRRDEARRRVDELLAAQRDAKTLRAKWEATRDTLAAALVPDDATADLVRRPGVLGEVPSFLRIRSGYEDAIAALIAPFADAAVVEGVDAAIDEVRRSREDGAGRVRMVIPAGEGPRAPQDLPALPGGAEWAAHVADLSKEVAAAVAPLLDGCAICEDLSEVSLLLAHPGVRRVATRMGDVFTPASAEGKGAVMSSPLARHADFEAAATHARAAKDAEDAATSDLEAANAHMDECVREANQALKALREEDATRARIAQERARISSAAQAAAAEAERARQVYERGRQQVEWTAQQVVESRAKLDASVSLTPGEDVAAAQKGADEAARAARVAREEQTEARLALSAAKERSRQAQARARSLRAQAATAREEVDKHRRAEALRSREVERVGRIVAGAESAVGAAAATLARCTEVRDHLQEERAAAQRRGAELRGQMDRLSGELTQIRDATHRDEIARAQIQMRIEQVEARCLEELSLEPDAVVEEFGPHNLAPKDLLDPDSESVQMVPYVRSAQEKALQRATRELAKLGKVNPLALEEHEALSKRHEFLVSQVSDLKKSKADLLRIIDDVDRLVQEAFASAFADTQEQFAGTFATLFPGGKGALVLTDPEDMLTTGIEIEARPAGKKVKRLSLLSGGERSLAAVAFLVAIFRARPSPFYVMDEVEAALDDANLSRLLDVFTGLRESSQLIVITHQKRTMEIADALYGVTMREGVTKVVSQRLGSG